MSEPEPRVSSRWMSRTFHAVLISIVLVVIGFRVYGYFATSESELGKHQTRIADQDMRELRATANQAYTDQDWELAATAFGRLSEKDPANVRNRIRLAYALHSSGQHDPALAEFLFLCRVDGNVRRWALYNTACIYAIKGDKRLALDYLSDAVAEGLRARNPILDDPDFASLKDDAEFRRLAELVKPFSQRDVYHRFDFLIGQWKLVGGDDQRLGAMTVAKGNEGYALQGEYTDASMSWKMTFFAYFDPALEKWRHIWLDQQGDVIQLQSAESENESLVLLGNLVDARSNQQLARSTYTESDEEIIRLELAVSRDEGTTWRILIDATLVPNILVKADQNEKSSPTP